MNTCVTISKLSKNYQEQTVLKNINWQINQGDIIGLLGKNGAGKSTLLNALLNVHPADSGNIHIFGEPIAALTHETKARIGFVPQQNDEIPWLTVKELIAFKKQFYHHWNDAKVTELVARWNIQLNKKMSQLSVGQAQHVNIMLALAHEPDLLVFDEPAAVLDPAARRNFLKELVDIATDQEKTIIFSTHITSDLERVANKVAILHDGDICYFDELDTLKENTVKLTITGENAGQLTVPNALNRLVNHQVLSVVVKKLDQNWLNELEQQGYQVTVTSLSLEDIFLEVTA